MAVIIIRRLPGNDKQINVIKYLYSRKERFVTWDSGPVINFVYINNILEGFN